MKSDTLALIRSQLTNSQIHIKYQSFHIDIPMCTYADIERTPHPMNTVTETSKDALFSKAHQHRHENGDGRRSGDRNGDRDRDRDRDPVFAFALLSLKDAETYIRTHEQAHASLVRRVIGATPPSSPRPRAHNYTKKQSRAHTDGQAHSRNKSALSQRWTIHLLSRLDFRESGQSGCIIHTCTHT